MSEELGNSFCIREDFSPSERWRRVNIANIDTLAKKRNVDSRFFPLSRHSRQQWRGGMAAKSAEADEDEEKEEEEEEEEEYDQGRKTYPKHPLRDAEEEEKQRSHFLIDTMITRR